MTLSHHGASNQLMKPTPHCVATSAKLHRHPALAYLFLVRPGLVYLYETHLSVADTAVSSGFYIDIVGLRFAHRDPTRDIIFLWAGDPKKSMLGLWGPSTAFGRDFHKSHLAFAVPLPELLAAGERLASKG
jgi:catechol-2,3-dioxygenase